MLRYPLTITPEENGTFLVEIKGLPGAFTACRSVDEARDMALDAALTMLSAMMADGDIIPDAPGVASEQGEFIELPAVVEMKLSIYRAMRRQGVSQVKLGHLLRTDPKSIRRLLDLYHASRWDHLEMALEALGYHARITVEPLERAPREADACLV